jgi:hypothetical protein
MIEEILDRNRNKEQLVKEHSKQDLIIAPVSLMDATFESILMKI